MAYACWAWRGGRRATFNSLSRDHYTPTPLPDPGQTGLFQLPLSGSRMEEAVRRANDELQKLSTPSLGITKELERATFEAQLQTFNSLSRDHPLPVTPSRFPLLPSPFNSLSRDHLFSTKAAIASLIASASVSFQLPLSGSLALRQEFIGYRLIIAFQLPLSGSRPQ